MQGYNDSNLHYKMYTLQGSPSVTNFIGGTASELLQANKDMYDITLAESRHFKLTVFDGRGTPFGVDVFKVVETGVQPFVTTGVAHRLPGIGQVGAGRVRGPLTCFEKAVAFLQS